MRRGGREGRRDQGGGEGGLSSKDPASLPSPQDIQLSFLFLLCISRQPPSIVRVIKSGLVLPAMRHQLIGYLQILSRTGRF